MLTIKSSCPQNKMTKQTPWSVQHRQQQEGNVNLKKQKNVDVPGWDFNDAGNDTVYIAVAFPSGLK